MNSKYIELSRKATILREDAIYNLRLGEMNPVIFEEFVGLVLDRNLPPVIWEPFASNDVLCRTQEFADKIDGLTLISFSLKPKDPRVKNIDSTKEVPSGWLFGGVLLHPPYFRANPFSNDRRDIALLDDKLEYLGSIKSVVESAKAYLDKNGLICVVCRSYRADGKEVRLDLWLLELLEGMGFVLDAVWSSEPDIVLIMRGA